MKRKAIAFLLAVMSVSCMFASCGDSKDEDKDTSPAASQSEEKEKAEKEEESADKGEESEKEEAPAEEAKEEKKPAEEKTSEEAPAEESETEKAPAGEESSAEESKTEKAPAADDDSDESREIASQIFKAMNTSIMDLDIQGINLSGNCIICSDKSKNVDVPLSDEELETLLKQVRNYCDFDNADFAAYIQDGMCAAVCAVSKGGSTAYIFPDNDTLSFSEGYDELKGRLS